MKDCAAHNSIFRVVWNRARGVWMVVGELARGLGKGNGRRKHSLRGLLMLIPLSLCSSLAMAAPTGGQVTAGTGTITQSGSTTTINQSSQNLSLSWKTFNVASSETVNFNQPNASALAINRIADTQGSTILGHINANGQVWLINPNGILFGSSAQVNVGGLVASTLDTADGSTFTGNGTGSVVNEGSITASQYVALLGHSVTNRGVITAQLGTVGGTVAMGAGDNVSLSFSGNALVKLQVNQSVIDALVANHGLIRADGGRVIMNAGARDTLLASVVNNDGIVQAQTVSNHQGTITLLGGMAAGTVNVGGTLDASAPNGGDGGSIETSAHTVKVADHAVITTEASGNDGSWLIDPADFTIAASGGDITGAVLSRQLGNSSVTVASTRGSTGTAGDINVNDAVSWYKNVLTLKAANNININANLTGSGTAKLALRYGQGAVAAGNTGGYYLNDGAIVSLPTGSNFSTKLGSNGATINWTVITALGSPNSTTKTDLQGINGDLAGHYVLGANIDAKATSTNTTAWGTNGFAPIGNATAGFTGSLDGLGHMISNLYINRAGSNNIGLFGWVGAGGLVRNVGLIDGSVSGGVFVGGLVGENAGAINNAYTTSTVIGVSYTGGLVGYNHGGTISNTFATGGVSGSTIGGLVGGNSGTISDSYATGSVRGEGADRDIGGLVGYNYYGGVITDAYSTGSVSGRINVGGLLGASGDYYRRGISHSYWDTTTSGRSNGIAFGKFGNGILPGATGETTAQMQMLSTFSNGGWSIADSGGAGKTWRIYDGQSYPLLASFLTPITVTANDASKIHDDQVYSGGNGVSYSVSPNATLLGTASYGGSAQAAVKTGSYTIVPFGFYSTSNRGYDVSYANGTLSIYSGMAPQGSVAVRAAVQSIITRHNDSWRGYLPTETGFPPGAGSSPKSFTNENGHAVMRYTYGDNKGLGQHWILDVVDGGMRLPSGLPLGFDGPDR